MKKRNNVNLLAIYLILIAMTSLPAIIAAQPTLVKFSLDGHTAYHVNTGIVDGVPVVFSATYHGKLFCHTQSGEFLWSANAGEGFPFDLESADIDGDGNDEAFVASSDGTLYAFNHDGSSLWTFSVEAPLYQVSAIVTETSSTIYTGGVDKRLYKIDKFGKLSTGKLLNGVIRLISSGMVLGDSTPELVVTTTRQSLMGQVSMYLFDPSALNQIWMKDISQTLTSIQTNRIFSLQVFDIDGDGKEEILCSHDHNMPDKFTLVQDNGSYGQLTSSQKPRTSPYTMNLLHYIHGTGIENDYLLNHYANRLFLMSKTGQIFEEITSNYAFTNSHYDSNTRTLFFGSAVSGGDGVYGFRLDQSDWKNLYRTVKPVGSMVKMEANLKLLEQQIDNYTAPAYQPPVAPIQASIADWKYHQLPSGYFKNVVMSDYLSWSENYDRSFMPLPWRNKRDRRKPYDMTSEEIINIAKNREKSGNPFFLWAGHGMDPFYMRMETLEEVLKAAPTTLKAFVFAEMEDSDESMRYVVDNLFRPLAELCLKNGNTKIFFRNKNIFWSGHVYLDVWADLFEDERLKSVFVAGLEETNCRTQTLSLYARMGMLQTNRMGEIGCRPVTDNANFARTWEWCQLQRMSHQIRAGAIARIMGANSFVQDIHTNTELELAPLYEMMDKGILPMVPPENIISVPDVALSIKSPPNSRYISTGVNGHNIAGYQSGSPKMVFDRLDVFWGGAPVPEWDFTNYAFNSKRRMTNFIARAPYGNIAVIPDDTDLESSRFTKFLRTDGRYWYDENGHARQPDEYKDYVISQLEEAAERLPIRVLGDVSWGALLLDSNHYRVVLLDPGYADPADRQAVIKLQIPGIDKARDILSGEELPINSDQISLTVPMGILRVIDLIQYPVASAGKDITVDLDAIDTVRFIGSAEGPEPFAYSWEKISGPECVLTNSDSSTLIVTDFEEGEYRFRLTVTDDEGEIDTDDVILRAICYSCYRPEVSVGDDKIVRLPADSLLMIGTVIDEGDGVASKVWKKLSGPDAELQGENTDSLLFLSPARGLYSFEFSVTSHYGLTGSDTISIEILNPFPPMDTIVKTESEIVIDGFKEDDWYGPVLSIDSLVLGHYNTSSTITFLWNDTALLAFAEIRDAYPWNDSGNEWWNDDALELYIVSSDYNIPFDPQQEYQFVLRLNTNDFFEVKQMAGQGIKSAVNKKGEIFNIEMLIPWSVIGHEPYEGQEIGMGISVRDDYDGFFVDAVKSLYGYSFDKGMLPHNYPPVHLGKFTSVSLNETDYRASFFTLFPNPAKNGFTISTSSESYSYNVLDINGRIIKKGIGSYTNYVSANDMKPGMYLVFLNTDNHKYVNRIVLL